MRASNSRNAAARRTRFAESRAGVMSASRVNRGNPCSRAARAPINTNSTSCRASVLNKSSGSRGAPGSDTACPMQEVSDILDLLEALLGRHPQDSRDFVQHVRSHHHARLELGMDVDIHTQHEPRVVVGSHMLNEVAGILRMTPEQRLEEVKNVADFLHRARR